MAYAPYDWYPAWEAAQANVYGDSSPALMQTILDTVGADNVKNALAKGIPKPVLSDLPGNVMANPVGGRFGFVDPRTHKPTQSITGNYIWDPNYGMQAIVQKKSPNSTFMNLARAGSFALAGGTMAAGLAPLLAGATGMSPQFSQLLMKLLIGQGSNVAQGGSINPGALAGSASGGYFGGSTGSAAGSLLGSLLSGR